MSQKALAYSEQEIVFARSPVANHKVNEENAGIVDSLLHPLALLIRRALTRAGRLELNLTLVDDEENILQALRAGIQIHSLYYSGGEALSTALLRALPGDVPVHEVAKRTCKKLFANDKVSRVFAIARTPAAPSLESLPETPRDIVALEDLSISGNIGSIVRTSLAFGIGGIVLLNAEPMDIYDRRMIRASRGHIFSLPVVTATTRELISFCQQRDLPVFVMAVRAKQLAHELAPLSRPLVLAFGNEKDGCSQELRDAATLEVQIPTDPKVESLNVSTAAGIMLYNRTWFNIPQMRK